MTTDLHNANNHLRGTMFDTNPSNPNAPIKRGLITIDKCILRFVVYPAKVSSKGNSYNPISLQYVPDSQYVLQSVPLNKD